MRFAMPPEEEAFRQEVRSFLVAELGPSWQGQNQRETVSPEQWEFSRRFTKKLADRGWLTLWAAEAQQQLNLDSGETLIEQLFFRLLVYIGNFPHTTLLAIAAFGYAVLEGTEGIGLSMRRRWATSWPR